MVYTDGVGCVAFNFEVERRLLYGEVRTRGIVRRRGSRAWAGQECYFGRTRQTNHLYSVRDREGSLTYLFRTTI